MKEYTTIEGFGNATYEIQKSRFLTYTAHVETEAEAREFVLSIKKKHFDALLHNPAFIRKILTAVCKNPMTMANRAELPAILFWKQSSSSTLLM